MDIKEILILYNNNIEKITGKFFNNPFDKEDAKQEAVIKLWKGLKSKKDGNTAGWINTTVANSCRDFIRVKKNRLDYDNEEKIINIKDTNQNLENNLISAERKDKIAKTIYELKPEYRNVVIFYEIDGLSYEEIAKKINKPVGTVKSRLYSARKLLYDKLSDLI